MDSQSHAGREADDLLQSLNKEGDNECSTIFFSSSPTSSSSISVEAITSSSESTSSDEETEQKEEEDPEKSTSKLVSNEINVEVQREGAELCLIKKKDVTQEREANNTLACQLTGVSHSADLEVQEKAATITDNSESGMFPLDQQKITGEIIEAKRIEDSEQFRQVEQESSEKIFVSNETDQQDGDDYCSGLDRSQGANLEEERLSGDVENAQSDGRNEPVEEEQNGDSNQSDNRNDLIQVKQTVEESTCTQEMRPLMTMSPPGQQQVCDLQVSNKQLLEDRLRLTRASDTASEMEHDEQASHLPDAEDVQMQQGGGDCLAEADAVVERTTEGVRSEENYDQENDKDGAEPVEIRAQTETANVSESEGPEQKPKAREEEQQQQDGVQIEIQSDLAPTGYTNEVATEQEGEGRDTRLPREAETQVEEEEEPEGHPKGSDGTRQCEMQARPPAAAEGEQLMEGDYCADVQPHDDLAASCRVSDDLHSVSGDDLQSTGSREKSSERQISEEALAATGQEDGLATTRRWSTVSEVALQFDDEDLEREFDEEPEFEPRIVSLKRNRNPREDYIMGEELGRGKFGVVLKCSEKTTGRQLAAKFISMRRKEDREDVEREVEIMSELQHKRLLQLYDAFDFGSANEMCLITELVEGGELFERIVDDDFDLTEKKAAIFLRQICEGLGFMHQRAIVHLDMKPENILCLSRTGNKIKLIDFGLARKLRANEALRVMFGTPDFAAPEVLTYEQVSFATDMWSVGVICYVLLSGLSPFMGDNDLETMANVTRATFDFNDKAFEPISELAKDFIARLLVREPEKRLSPDECLQHAWLQRGGAPSPQPAADSPPPVQLLTGSVLGQWWEASPGHQLRQPEDQGSPRRRLSVCLQAAAEATGQQQRPRASFGGESTTSTYAISLDKRRLKRYVVRRKWHKTVHAIMALGRMGANLALWAD